MNRLNTPLQALMLSQVELGIARTIIDISIDRPYDLMVNMRIHPLADWLDTAEDDVFQVLAYQTRQ